MVGLIRIGLVCADEGRESFLIFGGLNRGTTKASQE